MKLERVGYADLASISAQRNTCLVLPTLSHAIALWPLYREYVQSKHKYTHSARTGLAMQDTRTMLRLWVPYEREPTQPMDNPYWRRDFYLVSPYGGTL